jgi:hypothetical protein
LFDEGKIQKHRTTFPELFTKKFQNCFILVQHRQIYQKTPKAFESRPISATTSATIKRFILTLFFP